jgi:formylglycine-generating enzyme required for sulfatase activity
MASEKEFDRFTAAMRGRRTGMMRNLWIAWAIAAAFAGPFLPTAGADGSTVSNLTWTQGPNGTLGTKVDIYYDLAGPHGNSAVSAKLSKDNGATFPFSITTATGDIGANIPPGAGKHIVWDVAADFPNEQIAQAKIRIISDDGFAPLPVVTTFAINSGAAATASVSVTLNNTATNSPTQYMASELAAFTGAVWADYAIAPAFTLSGGVGVRTVYLKVRNAALVESAVVSDTIFLVPQTVSVAATASFPMGRLASGTNDDRTYGGTNEDPIHNVTLAAYSLGKYLVTNKEYCDVLNWALAQGYLKTSANAAWAGTGDIYAGGNLQKILAFTDSYCNIQYSGGVFSSKTRAGLPSGTNYSMDTHPVEDVSWYGSVAFCNWLSQMQGLTLCYDMTTANWPLTVAPPTSGGYRLPTEAEWERAAAWDGSKHWIYGFLSDTNASGTANRCNDFNSGTADNPLGLTGYPYTSPVGWFNGVNVSPNGSVTTVNSPSPVGAYDMSGNIWEWCGDWFAVYGSGALTNPTGPGTGSYRVLRGGSWFGQFRYSRSADRNDSWPIGAGNDRGFRVVRTP